MNAVKAWKERIIIPTYEIGEPEKYPVFLEKRVYQASSGVVYPHPVVEQISDTKIDKEWGVIFIENDFLKIMILPALGGRIQMAYDKIRERHFVYYNQVIKPALVGLTGPWISGGIEFNWPQHHRPSTYNPVDNIIEENTDGSVTVWVSEVERMFRTKGMAGFTLYPDKAYLELTAQLYNRTPHPQTFLWWANPAVAVNDHFQSVFPPDVNAVFDHGKRDVSEFPIAKGEYYKVNYAPGTDISRYKNIPVPTSYMAINSKYDFIGGYENDSKGGLLHIADHHISPGKKQWTWGNGEFGKAWDRNLTDQDGPYIELMCGVYTDNQPDFSWLQPYEEKSFKQYFMPYYNVGVVKNANKNILLNLELEDQIAILKLHATSVFKDCTVILEAENKIIFKEKHQLSPKLVFEQHIDVGNCADKELTAEVIDFQGRLLISWTTGSDKEYEIPDPAKAARQPEEIETTEQLYLRGLHLEQYRHASYDPNDYYLEALSREPKNIRNNNAMGLWYLRKGKFKEALFHFDIAITTLTQLNPNPYDGEAFFNKGLTLKYMSKWEEAYGAFFKACWNAGWQDAGYFNLAQIDCSRNNYVKALQLIDKSLLRNWHNHKARHLKIALLRKTNLIEEAKKLISASLQIDQFNFGALYEKYLLSGEYADLSYLKCLMRDNEHNYIEFSLDYAQAGLYEEAITFLNVYLDGKEEVYPMVAYFLGYFYQQTGNESAVIVWFNKAQKMSIDYCFPNRLEELIALQTAMDFNRKDAAASYYMGNFWYAARQYENAQKCWEISIDNDVTNAICYRNLALLYYNKTGQKDLAKEYLEHAFKLDYNSARLLMELDQLYKKMNCTVNQRLQLLEDKLHLTESRDDLFLERIALYHHKREFEKALELLENRQFHPWEGGEGKVPFLYINIHIELAKRHINNRKYQSAIKHLEAAQIYPHNLGEGKLFGARENDIFYWLGCAYNGLNDEIMAIIFWGKAAEGLSDPSPAIFYNDQQPDKIFYQGLALLKLKKMDEAKNRFNKLINYGREHMNDRVKMEYFAISLPDLLIWEEDLDARNRIHCHYLIGLGELGMNNLEASIKAFSEVLEHDLYHLPALLHLNMVNKRVG